MEKSNLLSPTQLWADYDEKAVKLKSNFLKYDTDKNQVVNFEVYLSSDTDGEDAPLIYCRGKIPKNGFKNAVLIYINGYEASQLETLNDTFLPRGYGVVTFDYMGVTDKKDERYTIYPQSLNYANYIYSAGHLDRYVGTPKSSCVYVWSCMCRNVITFIKNLLGQDIKIYMRSSLEGGNILWQVAGMDKRVDGIIASNNAGWAEHRGIFRFSDSPDEYDIDEPKIKWMSACSPQAYAKFVTCPVLYLSGTNTGLTSIDRVEKTLELTVNNSNNHICLCTNLTNTLNTSAKNTLTMWLDNIYFQRPMPKSPKLTFDVSEGKAIAKMEYDDKWEIDKLVISYSYDEINSEFRHWNNTILPSANPSFEIPVRVGDKRIFAFASVYYKDGQYYSSLPAMLNLEGAKLDKITPERTRIIFERKRGLGIWAVDNIKGEYFMPELKAGGSDIMGVTAIKGNLSTYYISDKNFERRDNSIFQFDCYSNTARTLKVVMSVENDDFSYTSYYVEVNLPKDEWQKISLSHGDFKTKDLVSLKEWNNVKKLSFLDIDNTLINNIIWV